VDYSDVVSDLTYEISHFVSTLLLIGSTHSAKSLEPRQYVVDCDTVLCGQACIMLFASSNCDAEDFNVTTGFPWGTTILEDTVGVITPFNSTQEYDVQVMSLSYVTPLLNSTNCPYIQFEFFDASNQTAGVTYITPGQNYTPCVTFDGTQVVAYSGGTMLVEPPKNLLELADEYGNDENGYVYE
jgi:hypothetical protein